MNKYIWLLISTTTLYSATIRAEKKIVGLMQVRNEEIIIEQALRGLAYYVDALVIIDDASTDNTLAIINKLADELPIERILTNDISTRENGKESDNSQKLLAAGRAIGGTHFIVIDADEMFTANCLTNNYLRNIILSLMPGDRIKMQWLHLWRSLHDYRSDWPNYQGEFIFCDDQQCCYKEYWLHGGRIPQNLHGNSYAINGPEYGLMHFQFVNWESLLIKQAWYRCLERIRSPQKSIKDINNMYASSKNELGIKIAFAPDSWFNQYTNIDFSVYKKPSMWRKKNVLDWFDQYGKQYFKDLDIWDVPWNV